MWWMRTDVGRTGERQCAFTAGREEGRAGRRGGGERRERESEMNVLWVYITLQEISAPPSQRGISISITAEQVFI